MKTKIILVKPEHPGNIGAIARAMANFGFKELIMIKPQCDPKTEEARKRAKHGIKILEKAKIKQNLKEIKADLKIATTGKLGNDHNLKRTPITPKQLAEKIRGLKGTIAIIMGPESKGLTNKELEEADITVSIPAAKEYPILNLSHATTIILYELKQQEKLFKEKYPLATEEDKKRIQEQIKKILKKIPFNTPHKKKTQETLWKKIIGKTFMTKREYQGIIGLLKKINQELKKTTESKKTQLKQGPKNKQSSQKHK